MEAAKFYCFPYYRKPSLMYRTRSVLDTDLFKVFYFKLFRSRAALRYRMEWPFFQNIGERLSFRNIHIPNENIQLVYSGYDSTVMFEMDELGSSVNQVWRKCEDNRFQPEAFLGYPIFYDYKSDQIEHEAELTGFLKAHWSAVKGGYPIHGDLTHYNLLVDQTGHITAIDAKPHSGACILTDLFYFYSFFRYSMDKHLSKGTTQYEKLVGQLDRIYKVVFADENPNDLVRLFSKIYVSEVGNVNVRQHTSEFIRVVSNAKEGH